MRITLGGDSVDRWGGEGCYVDVVMDKKMKGGEVEVGEVLERCTGALLPQPAKKNPTEDYRQM